ncbi:MAG: DUF1583 domain-containing protein, partial [Planctomycetaceae bacterium]|nr:DUF1583 domain-containing protein [Planctomycetaceae bacterium]
METKSVRRTAWLLTGATPFGRARRGILCFVLLAVVSTSSVADDPPSSDAWSLDAIFAEQHVTNSGWTVHNRAMELSPEERYEFLSRWVLPGEDHNSIRLQIAFSPTSPAPAVQRSIRDQKEHSLRDTASGGQLVSPVYDLIDVAHELDNLKDVNDRIQEWTPPTTSVAQFEKLALLTLCAMKTGEPNTPDLLREFIAATPQEIQPDRAPSPPEWLVYHRAIEVPDYALIVGDPIYRYLGWVNADFDKPIPERHWSGMMGLVRTKLATESDTEIPNNSPVPHPEWTAVSMATARTRGLGSPPTHWLLDPGEATNLASHDNDYLYYSVPMRGNFEVECDVTSFGWRDSQLLAAGFWVAPVYTLEDYDLGTIRQTFPRQSIGVTLSKVRDWIHYRTVVRDNVARTYFNGRLIHTQGIEADHDPWLAVRSSYRHDGGVRNVRITGTPTIPESIDLSSDPDLDCWIPYYGEPVNESAPGWRGTNNEIVGFGYVGGISANESEDSHIGHEQRLLRYHRPLLEDGSLEYEFLYVPGRIHVHPALDRLVLLLTPEGVRIHWANDGPFERTELAANNVFDEPENRRWPAELPLIDGQWNKVRLSIEGDQLSVVLNDVTVYEQELEL